MAEHTGISWCDATFNHVRGCTKVSPECDRCYAETMSGRNPSVLGIWGADGTRVVAAESYWKTPLKWNETARKEGRRIRVFCASLADVFEEWDGPVHDTNGVVDQAGPCMDETGEPSPTTLDCLRRRLFALIDATPHLTWMLLTKRPENIRRMWAPLNFTTTAEFRPPTRPNVWLGTTAGLQETADRNVPKLLECADLSPVLWVSCEPMLGPVDFTPWLTRLHWIITGGESGHGARPCHPDWVRSVRDQCQAAGVAFHHKQHGEWVYPDWAPKGTFDDRPRFETYQFPPLAAMDAPGPIMYRVGKKAAGRSVDGVVWDQFPA